MKLSPRLSSADEQGQASLFLLVGLTLSLLALSLLYVRLGNANDLRSQAQSAADAAALAAVGAIRDEVARDLAEHRIVFHSLHKPAAARTAAEKYARANGAILSEIRASDNNNGQTGNIIRVEIRGANCQRELEDDRSRHWSEILCTGEEDEDTPVNIGNAAAVAEIVMPNCNYTFGEEYQIIGVNCDGTPISYGDFTSAQQAITTRLTDREGRWLYRPLESINEDDEEIEEERVL
ncbi:pilus assembly protein TadG-related protein [Marinactinospora thermotolerans]|uniref:pilus assembly protein TadG-related protein n=1 Tax=Marinactinospora thermotolerans TaxID=531310 RepID=UPI0009995B5C|nr:pilus assembly protein TadG-related protein [Marinactinospora thermotolerans]